jgi:hypothetical protein
MERESTEEQEDRARGGGAGTNVPAGSGSSSQAGDQAPNDSAPGITGGYGTGGLDVEEQTEGSG